MVMCSCYNCNSRSERKEPGISFHRFPKDPERCSIWVKQMKLMDWAPTINSRICSKHFENHCFNRGGIRVHLLDNAIPSIFLDLPLHIKSRERTKRSATPTIPKESRAREESPGKKRLRRQLFHEKIKNYKKTQKIRVLSQKFKRYKRKIVSLNQILKELKGAQYAKNKFV